jgi:glutamyl-tRNA synthetase
MVIQNAELDDVVLVRSDGIPTYNFSVVVDDIDMKVTHVIRGDDHLANTPRQIHIIHALQQTPPRYAHVPMILGGDGKRLSKRHGAVSVQHYRDMGILPEALLNYLVRLGWSHGDQEIFTREEMIEHFQIDHLNKAHAIFNLDKLLWLNAHYIKNADPESLVAPFQEQLKLLSMDVSKGPSLTAVIRAQQERSQTLAEMAEKSIFFFKDFENIEEKVRSKHLNAEGLAALKVLKQAFEALKDWQASEIHKIVEQTAATLNLKLGQVAQPLRVAVTGGTVSPPIDITLELLGKEKSLDRLNQIVKA